VTVGLGRTTIPPSSHPTEISRRRPSSSGPEADRPQRNLCSSMIHPTVTIAQTCRCPGYRQNIVTVRHTCLPDSASGLSGLPLCSTVSAIRITWPIERQAVANRSFAEIDAGHRAGCHGAAVTIEVDGKAVHRPPCDRGVKIVRCLRGAAARDRCSRCDRADRSVMRRYSNRQRRCLWISQRIAVDDAGLTCRVVGKRGGGVAEERSRQRIGYSFRTG
jgi:hypothetical protein